MPRFSAADGTGLHYTDDGAGLAVLCLAGLTRNGRDFDHLAPHLTGIRLIRLDHRGRGESDRADPGSYTVVQEASDALALLDHLSLPQVAILGTSRGGLIAMCLAAMARDRLRGVLLNDIGPVIAPQGLDFIKTYLGRNPAQDTYAAAAAARAETLTGFQGVVMTRWLAEVRNQYEETPAGLVIRYDPRLRETVLATRPTDLWPWFDALAGLPLALIRGANSDLLSSETAAEMLVRRPDMIHAEVPGRGHVPFLDEPEALAVIREWLERCE